MEQQPAKIGKMCTEQHLRELLSFVCICQIGAKSVTYVNQLIAFYNLTLTEASGLNTYAVDLFKESP